MENVVGLFVAAVVIEAALGGSRNSVAAVHQERGREREGERVGQTQAVRVCVCKYVSRLDSWALQPRLRTLE